MATKQQREIAIKKLSRILKIASKKSIDTELLSEIMFLTRFLTIKRIKKCWCKSRLIVQKMALW